MAYDSYIICTTPRSGSTLLCELLKSTGVAGVPASYFHAPSMQAWQNDLDLRPDVSTSRQDALITVFNKARQTGSGDTGIFGLRQQRQSFGYLIEQLDQAFPNQGSDAERLEAAFGKTLFIYLTRANKLDQAISCVKAMQTGLWHQSADGSEFERLAPPQAPYYDAEMIKAELDEFTTYEAEWKAWFKRQSLTPMRISYETLSADPSAIIQQILTALGRDAMKGANLQPPLAKLSDQLNQKWAQRYRSENPTLR